MPDANPATRKFSGRRKYPAQCPPVLVDNRPVILHVTFAVAERRAILASTDVQAALCNAWHEADQWIVGTYMIMPDHVHLFCAPGTHQFPTVRKWGGYWKREAGDRLPLLTSVWIKNGWDTQMRDQAHYLRKLEYVRQNPVRKGLVTRAEEWPYQGTLCRLDWIIP